MSNDNALQDLENINWKTSNLLFTKKLLIEKYSQIKPSKMCEISNNDSLEIKIKFHAKRQK